MIDLKDALFLLKNKNEINKFLLDILTTKERKDFEERLKVAQLLYKKEFSYLEISKIAKVSTTTVTRVAKSLNENDGYRIILDRVINKDDKENLEKFNIAKDYYKVSDEVSIYYELYGNENGVPLIVLHGGPGTGIEKDTLELIDLKKYLVVMFDQRGCGKSTPKGVFSENNTQNLIEDIYKLRNYLKIDKFVLFGNSWGSTLGVLYSQKYHETVQKLVVSAIFLGRNGDDKWFLQDSKMFFPDWFEDFSEIAKNKDDIVASYYSLVCENENLEKVKDAVCRFYNYGIPSASLFFNTEELEKKKTTEDIDEDYIKNVQIFLTYAKNLYYVNEVDWLNRESMSVLDKVPTIIIKARYDFDSPLEQGYILSKLLPKAKFIITEGSGHSKFDEPNRVAITEALK